MDFLSQATKAVAGHINSAHDQEAPTIARLCHDDDRRVDHSMISLGVNEYVALSVDANVPGPRPHNRSKVHGGATTCWQVFRPPSDLRLADFVFDDPHFHECVFDKHKAIIPPSFIGGISRFLS